MEVTYIIIVAIITYFFGAITKTFIDSVPNKFIPIQNVLIGIISAMVCYFTKVETDLLQSIVLCFMASTGANGVHQIVQTITKGGE